MVTPLFMIEQLLMWFAEYFMGGVYRLDTTTLRISVIP